MSAFEPEEVRPSKTRRNVVVVLAVLAVLAVGVPLWYAFRHYPEKRAVERFFDALTAGDVARAFQLKKPDPTDTMNDFLSDWGPNGFYGPVKSYRIDSVEQPKKGGSGVIVTVEVSPYTPMPAENDVEKSRYTRKVRLWVQSDNKSISSAPPL